MEDGSGGYNGGGSGLKSNGYYGYAGGGSTDIRYEGTKVTQYNEDYRILVAGGGGGADNASWEGRGNGTVIQDDGTGGSGGGTVGTNLLKKASALKCTCFCDIMEK